MIRNLILIFSTTVLAQAQTAPPARPEFGQGLKENAEKLQQYSYKRRLEITVKGRSSQRLELVRYVDGKMETVPLEAPQRAGGQSQGRGLRGMIMRKEVEKKKEEMKKEVEQLRGLLKQYTPGSPSMRAALEKANISHEDRELKVEANGVVQPSDSFTLIWNTANRRPERLEIHTALDKKPVQMTIEYASLPDGPFYPARTTLTATAKDLTVSIDTFEYSRSTNGN